MANVVLSGKSAQEKKHRKTLGECAIGVARIQRDVAIMLDAVRWIDALAADVANMNRMTIEFISKGERHHWRADLLKIKEETTRLVGNSRKVMRQAERDR